MRLIQISTSSWLEIDLLILLLYVDDLFITGDERPIAVCKRDLASEYEMTDIGLMHYFLGLEVW